MCPRATMTDKKKTKKYDEPILEVLRGNEAADVAGPCAGGAVTERALNLVLEAGLTPISA
jgi:hypothetical protein